MASTKADLAQKFIFTINEDIKLYSKLLELLQHQKMLYLKFDGEAMSNNINNQLPLLKQLGQNANQRSQALKALQLPCSRLGAQKLIRALPAKLSINITKQWQKLETLILECQKYNHDNGQSSAAFHELLGEFTGQKQHSYEEQVG